MCAGCTLYLVGGIDANKETTQFCFAFISLLVTHLAFSLHKALTAILKLIHNSATFHKVLSYVDILHSYTANI